MSETEQIRTPLPPTPVLETERLILRPKRLDDAPVYQRLFPRWEVVRHLAAKVPWPYPDDGAEQHVREAIDNMARGFKFHWAITLKGGDDHPIGAIDLWRSEGEEEQRGFWLAPEHQGRGLMTEAADRVTDYALIELGWPQLYLSNAVENKASHRVKEKQGAVIIGYAPLDTVQGPTQRVVWRLTRETWLAHRAATTTEAEKS